MADLLSNSEVTKVIAFYLPQFHSIPENDKAYGEGFTEWTNVKKAEALFEGHYQPRIPLHGNYYNLLNPSILCNQAALAKKYGIYGFCYYHYWFKDGKKLLEKPVEIMLNHPEVDIPFCLCWANENWSKKWDGGNNELIAEQDYGSEDDWKNHLDYLSSFFKDPRYITLDNKPVLLIYKPELMPDLAKWVNYMHTEIKKYGFDDIVLIVQYPNYYLSGYNKKTFDYYIEFEPAYTRIEEAISNESKLKKSVYNILSFLGRKDRIVQNLKKKLGRKPPESLQIRDYSNDWYKILHREKHSNVIKGAFVDWDNTPRNKKGLCYQGANPELFKDYFSQLVGIVREGNCPNYIFINAWNEWAEGAYLEPDTKYQFGYLEGIKYSLDRK